MPPFLVAGWVYVLTRLSGTLQKHVFGPMVRPHFETLEKAARAMMRSQDPEVREKGRQALRLLSPVTASYDFAEGIAYDDPVELLADLAALGVKTGLFKLGEAVLPRILAALGVKSSIELVGALTDAIQSVTKIESFLDLIPALGRFREQVDEAVDRSNPVITSGIDVAFEIGELATAAAGFTVAPGPVAAFNLAKQAVDVVTSILSFFGLVQETVEPFIPEPRILPKPHETLEETLEREKRQRGQVEKEKAKPRFDLEEAIRGRARAQREKLFDPEAVRSELEFLEALRRGEFPRRQPGESFNEWMERVTGTPDPVGTFKRRILSPIGNLFAGVGFQQRLVDLLKKDG